MSVFYITQFFTSLLWSGIADRHGRRAVLVASMAVSGAGAVARRLDTNIHRAAPLVRSIY